MSEPEQWSVAEAAKQLGIKPKTLTGYLARGQMPEPDGRVGRTPWWYPDTIKGWHRPTRGTRQLSHCEAAAERMGP